MQYKERTIDPYLFRAIVRTTGRIPLIPYDLKKIKTLEIYDRYRRMPSYETISFFRFKEHDFSVLGEMENLHTLRIYFFLIKFNLCVKGIQNLFINKVFLFWQTHIHKF